MLFHFSTSWLTVSWCSPIQYLTRSRIRCIPARSQCRYQICQSLTIFIMAGWQDFRNYIKIETKMVSEKKNRQNSTHLTAFNPGLPEWAGIRNARFIFSSQHHYHCFVAAVPSNHIPPSVKMYDIIQVLSANYSCPCPQHSSMFS